MSWRRRVETRERTWARLARWIGPWLGFGFLVLLSTPVAYLAQADGPPAAEKKRPLDLPVPLPDRGDEDEDEPETILFYGEQFEADAFFWCLDISGSMAEGAKMDVLRVEVTEAIRSLSSRAQFSLVAFHSSTQVWSAIPVDATPAQRAAAISWVQALQPEDWTCLAPAGVRILQISQLSRRREKAILIVGDGVPLCQGVDTSAQCLAAITGANWQRTPVHTLYVSEDDEGQQFMQELATANGGRFIPLGS